jgi:hypothetical protein
MSSEEISELKEHEQANSFEEEEHAPRSRRRDHNWIAGVVLIGIGVIFLLSNTTGLHFNNWWALFILIPAVTNFGNAFRSYQRHGRFTKSARGSLTGGLLLALVASAFLFNLDWGLIWPLFLIVGGLSALLGGWFD